MTDFHGIWWRHQMEIFFALLALCVWNSPVTGEFPSQRPVTWSFWCFLWSHTWTNGWVNNWDATVLHNFSWHLVISIQFLFRYKWLETLFYLIIGICPSIVVVTMLVGNFSVISSTFYTTGNMNYGWCSTSIYKKDFWKYFLTLANLIIKYMYDLDLFENMKLVGWTILHCWRQMTYYPV